MNYKIELDKLLRGLGLNFKASFRRGFILDLRNARKMCGMLSEPQDPPEDGTQILVALSRTSAYKQVWMSYNGNKTYKLEIWG